MSGGHWGLACNAIHFIDLVSWWTGSTVNDVDCQGLEDWLPSKRPGYQEVFGSIMVNFCGGSSLELSCNRSDLKPRIEVETSKGIWLIEEVAGKAVGLRPVISGQLTLQSVLTAPVVIRFSPAAASSAWPIQLPSIAHSLMHCFSTGTIANLAKIWPCRSPDFYDSLYDFIGAGQ